MEYIDTTLTRKQERDLFLKLSSPLEGISRSARYRIVLSNIRLVYSIALKYSNNNDSYLDFDDLVSYGILGLFRAIDKFDVSQDLKFSTYAYFFIDRYIKLSLGDASFDLNVERHYQEKIRKFKKLCSQYMGVNGCNPSLDEMVDLTGYSKDELLMIEGLCYKSISLSDPLFDDGTDMYDLVSYDDDSMQDVIEKRELCSVVIDALDCLNENERKVICLSFGLCGCSSMGVEGIAQVLGCSHQNVSKIKKNALNKLGKSRKLSLYYKGL